MISKATRKNPTRAASSESAGAKIRNWAVWRSEDRQLEKDDLAAGLPEFMCYLSQKHMIDELVMKVATMAADLSAAMQEIASPGTSWLAQSGGTRLHTQPVADGAVPMQVVGPGL